MIVGSLLFFYVYSIWLCRLIKKKEKKIKTTFLQRKLFYKVFFCFNIYTFIYYFLSVNMLNYQVILLYLCTLGRENINDREGHPANTWSSCRHLGTLYISYKRALYKGLLYRVFLMVSNVASAVVFCPLLKKLRQPIPENSFTFLSFL